MEKITSKIALSGVQGDVNILENRDRAQEARVLGISIQCCTGIIWYHGLPQDE